MVSQASLQTDGLFTDARELLRIGIRELDAGDIRQAAEKAWGATVAATKGMLLERTGQRPETTALTRIALEREADEHPDLDSLRLRWYTRESSLHGHCFYDGICEPRETIERRIRETSNYITDAENAISK